MLMLLVLGFIGLGVEISQLLLEHRKQQSVADAAAIAAASAPVTGASNLQYEARAVAAQLGYRHGENGVTVTAANPPTTGAHTGDAKYVEVKIQRAFTPAFVQLFRQGAFTVQARAMAKAGEGSKTCIMALGTTGTALSLANNATLTMPGCGVMVNSTSNSAASLDNNATINGDLTVAGDVSQANNAVVTGTLTTGASGGTNPYAAYSPTGERPEQDSSGSTLDPGVYPDGWDFKNETKTLRPGTYYIQSKLALDNNVTLTGTGVTIVIEGNYDVRVRNNVTLNLSAPTTGDNKGMLLYSSPNNTSVTQTFGNNTTLNITGALYLPSQTVKFDNNVTTTSSSCTQIISKSLELDNNAAVTLKPDCSGAGTAQLGSSSNASLVE